MTNTIFAKYKGNITFHAKIAVHIFFGLYNDYKPGYLIYWYIFLVFT